MLAVCLTMSIAIEILMWVIAAIWILGAFSNMVYGRRLAALDELSPDWRNEPLPSVSIIVPARDEAARIERTARSFLAQEALELQLLIVDDRSCDDTMNVLNGIASEDPRLQPVRIDDLPDGWLGKCHAMHTGAQQATGDWLLFADADTTFRSKDTIRRAIDLARSQHADHVCLLPRLGARSLWARAAACGFIISAARRLDRINRDLGKTYFGAGAFNLVRADTYRSFDGHTPLRLEVLDDINLSALVRRADGKTRLRTAFNDMETSWGSTIRELISVLEKNLFAIIGYRSLLMLALSAMFVVVWTFAVLGPAWSLLTGSLAPTVAFIGVLLSGASAMRVARQLGWSRKEAFLSPLVSIVFVYAGLRSMLLTLRRGGVQWRDTFYPLAQLRAGRLR